MKIVKSIIIYILTLEAKIALMRFKPRIIAVTGNVGKTSTKDAIYTAISGSIVTRKSKKSFNSEIGVPLAVLGLPNAWNSAFGWAKNVCEGLCVALGTKKYSHFPDVLVLEIGADHPGDISRAGKWIHPDIVVLTRMSSVPVHVEFFESADDVLREKMELVKAMKSDGVIVVNGDDELFMNALKNFSSKTITYGAKKDADIRIVGAEITCGKEPLLLPTGISVLLEQKSHKGQNEAQNNTQSLEIAFGGILGNHVAYCAASAVAVAQELGIDPRVASKALSLAGSTVSAGSTFAQEMPRGRMNILKGKDHSVIIDDTYNSSPLACEEALKTLEKLSVRGRKIAVLADMKELGDMSVEAHTNIGILTGGIVHTLVVVGEDAQYIAKGAREAGLTDDRIMEYKTSDDALESFRDFVRAGDVILVKGSQSMRMERISKVLLLNENEASDVLVRQEKEWEGR